MSELPILGGSVCIKNGNRLDFCWREAVQSLLPVCDTVLICDGGSDDGTMEDIGALMTKEPKVQLCTYPWPDPKGHADFWVEWLNYAREQLKAKYHFQMDADEVLAEWDYPVIERFKESMRRGNRFSLRFTRHNFWRDHRHLIPHGFCCADRVVRVAPQDLWLASDGIHPKGATANNMAIGLTCEIFHYGFLRKRDAFFEKERLLQGYFFNTYDPRLEKADAATKTGGNWMEQKDVTGWESNLVDYTGPHPKVAHQWLDERGYPV